MKTKITLSKNILPSRTIRAVVLLITSIGTLTQTGKGQGVNDKASDGIYRHLSTLNSGPSYRYNITTFIGTYLPTGAVQFSDKEAKEINASAQTLNLRSDELAAEAKAIREESINETDGSTITGMAKKADSLDNLSANFQLEAEESAGDALERQYSVNEREISGIQKNVSYPTDELTLASLLNREAEFYYSRAGNEAKKAQATLTIYLSKSIMDDAGKDLTTALLKQQCAENVYISLRNNTSLEVAMKIDSMLTPIAPSMSNAGTIIFTVQVGDFNGGIPADKAQKFLEISGLGLTRHNENNGKTVYTVGEYTNYTCADLLSHELVEDGFTDSYVATYTGTGKNAKPFEGIALK